MADLDELSRTIGQLEGKMGAVEKKVGELCTKVDGLRNILTNHRIKVASLAGAISLIVSISIGVLIYWLEKG